MQLSGKILQLAPPLCKIQSSSVQVHTSSIYTLIPPYQSRTKATGSSLLDSVDLTKAISNSSQHLANTGCLVVESRSDYVAPYLDTTPRGPTFRP